MKAKLISFLLSVILFMQVFCIVAAADNLIASGTCGDNLTWTLSTDGVLTIFGNGAMNNYTLGAGSNVAPWNPWSQDFIHSIVFADGCNITHIGSWAFYAMYSLQSITIPDSVITIGEGAFESSASLRSVSLSKNLTVIGDDAFGFCMGLNAISLPDTLTTIGIHAFFRSGLTSIKLPAAVTSIGDEAFAYGSLSTVYVQGDEPHLGTNVFGQYDGSSITTYAPQNQSWQSYDTQWGNVIYTAPKEPTPIKEYIAVAGQDTNFYGANVSTKNEKGEIYELAKDFYDACNNYLNVLKTELGKEAAESGAEKTEAEMAEFLMERDANTNEPALTPAASIKDDKTAMTALYKAYARFLKQYTDKGIEMNRIKIKDDAIKISASLVQDIQSALTVSNYYVVNVDGCTVTFNTWITGQGTATIRKNKTTHQVFVNTKTLEQIANVLEDYVNELLDVAHDAMKQTLSGVISDIANVTGFADWEKSAIKSALKNAVTTLKAHGLGDAYTTAEKCRQGYALLKNLISAKDSNALEDLFGSRDKVKELYDEINELNFSDQSVTNKSIDQAVKKITQIKGKLASKLYSYYTGLPEEEDKGFFGTVSSWFCSLIQCPVDFEVFDADGKCVGSVHDGIVEHDDSIYIEVHGDVKTLYIPTDKPYYLKLTATDIGSMNYVIERYDEGEPQERWNYFDIELIEGKQFGQSIENSNFDGDNASNLITTEEEITFDSHYTADDPSAYAVITTETSDEGIVFGGGNYPLGDSVELTALPTKENYTFIGWFDGEEILSSDITYRFTALEDRTIHAEFAEISEPASYLCLTGDSDYLLDDGHIREIPTDTTVAKLLEQFKTPADLLKVFNLAGEEITDTEAPIRNGYRVQFCANETVTDEAFAVLQNHDGSTPEYSLTFTANKTAVVSHTSACVVMAKTANDTYDKLTASYHEDVGYSFAIPDTAESITIAVKGDYSGDGDVSVSDAKDLQKAILGKEDHNGTPDPVCDINGDGRITAIDLALIAAAALDKFELSW